MHICVCWFMGVLVHIRESGCLRVYVCLNCVAVEKVCVKLCLLYAAVEKEVCVCV